MSEKTTETPALKVEPSQRERQLERSLKDVLFAHDELVRYLQRMGVTIKADDSVEKARGLVK